MIEMPNKITYTADDEFPNCSKCDYFDGNEKFCSENCGHKHWWNGYSRTVRKDGSNHD